MFKFILLAVIALSLSTQPLAASTNDGAAIACEQAGGKFDDGNCDTSGPSTFDLFGKIIIGILIWTAIAGKASD